MEQSEWVYVLWMILNIKLRFGMGLCECERMVGDNSNVYECEYGLENNVYLRER